MSTPTPEQFLAQPYDPDEDADEQTQALLPDVDPLASIAVSLEALSRAVVDIAVEGVFGPIAGRPAAARDAEAADAQAAELLELGQAYDDLEDKHRALYELLADVEKIVAKSKSQVSLEVKAAINAWHNPEVPVEGEVPAAEPVQGLPVPAADAPIEVWQVYAAERGVENAGQLNRSQIRTLLGLPHFDSAGE